MDTESKVRALAEKGLGRTNIMRECPEASEHLIKKVIKEVKGIASPVSEPQIVPKRPTVNHREIVASLQPMNIEVGKPAPAKVNPDYLYTAVLFSDLHAPYQCYKAVSVLCKVLEMQRGIRLDLVGDLGDFQDFQAISRFEKSALRLNQLHDELVVGAKVRALITEAAGDAQKKFFKGNHEARLESYINNQAPALANLPQLQLQALMGLESSGWEYHDEFDVIKDSFVLTHGHIVSGAAGATAKKELDGAWMSGASGHVHRAAIHHRRVLANRFKNTQPFVWVETGCVCKQEPEYQKGMTSDWQQAVVVVRFSEDGSYIAPEIIHIHDGRAFFNGKLIEVS